MQTRSLVLAPVTGFSSKDASLPSLFGRRQRHCHSPLAGFVNCTANGGHVCGGGEAGDKGAA